MFIKHRMGGWRTESFEILEITMLEKQTALDQPLSTFSAQNCNAELDKRINL